MTTLPAAVITSYRPDDRLLAIVDALRAQVSRVVIVDDGSGPTADVVLDDAAARGALVVRIPDNAGIAAALNAGIDAAFETGAESVVTFDQDSLPAEGFVAALADIESLLRASGHAPRPVVPEYFAGVRQGARIDADGFLLTRGAIQSGMLLSRELIEDVGPMRVDFFIDLVDTEFELRCLSAGRPIVAAPGLGLSHGLGARFVRHGLVLPGTPRVMTLSAPFRYYYRARNRVLINREYARRFPLRILRDSIVDRVYFSVVTSIARPRGTLAHIIRAGRRRGRQGEGGKMPRELHELAEHITWAADRLPG